MSDINSLNRISTLEAHSLWCSAHQTFLIALKIPVIHSTFLCTEHANSEVNFIFISFFSNVIVVRNTILGHYIQEVNGSLYFGELMQVL